MANLSADTPLRFYGTPTKIEVPVAETVTTTYYAGQLVFFTGAATVGVNQTPASGDLFVGICAEHRVTTAAGNLIPVYVDGVWSVPISGTTIADVGLACMVDANAVTNNPADLKASSDITEAADDAIIGRILSVVDSRAIVRLSTMSPKYQSVAATDAVVGFYNIVNG